MSIHEEIVGAIDAAINASAGAVILSPTTIALAVQGSFQSGEIEHHIKYTSLEHLKHMARRRLAGRFEADGEDNEAHQQDMFSGHLQDRYPAARQRGVEPQYKLRESMNEADFRWNITNLTKAAQARLAHVDALQAWWDSFRRTAA